MESFHLFQELTRQNRGNSTVQKLKSAMHSFYKRLFPEISYSVPQLVVMDDEPNAFAAYYLAMNSAVAVLAKTQKGVGEGLLPVQIDLWIIPENVASTESRGRSASAVSDDDFDVDEEKGDAEDESAGVDCIGNLEWRLTNAKWKFEKIVIDDKERMNRQFLKNLEKLLNGRRNQRILVYVDRRNPQNVVSVDGCAQYIAGGYDRLKARPSNVKRTWADTVYFVQAPQKRFGELPDREENTPEAAFWASSQCMFPRVKEDKFPQNDAAVAEGSVGCLHNVNGFQFMVSWQAEHSDCVRHYLFTNGHGMRFLPRDVDKLWPMHFKRKDNGETKKVHEGTRKTLTEMRQVHDDEFAFFYKKSTRSDLC